MTTADISYPPTCAASSVATLLLRVADGEPAAWREIVRRYGEVVSAAVRSFRLQDADARDAVQTTWLQLAAHAGQIRHPQRLGGWLVTTARRACLHILRHTPPNPAPIYALAETVADPFPGPEQLVVDADATRTLWNFVNELPPQRQTLLRALFTEHPRGYAEVARVTGIPVGGVGPTRARALAQLRGRLEQHGLGPEAW
jgi:RNA polymerase sigma factor (sigma-70 family)